MRPATREETFPIALAAVLLSFVALLLSFSRGYLLLYGDAVAHRNLPDLTEHERPVTPVRGLQKG